MKPKELVEKLAKFTDKYDGGAEVAAKAAFLANLTEILGIELPTLGKEEDQKHHFYFYSGCVVGRKEEIKEEDIRKAHLSMIFVWSRAIISDALGYTQLTNQGVPTAYEVTP